MLKNNRFVIAVLAPIILLFFVFSILPIGAGFTISLFDYNPLRADNDFIGLANYEKLLDDAVFAKALRNTLYFVFGTVPLNIAITLGLAALISSLKWAKLRALFRVLFFMPCVAPLVASSIVWKQMYNVRYGIINVILERVFHLDPVNWLGTAAWLIPAVIIFTLWADIGYNIIIFSAGMDGIPHDFYEAADLDGAGPLSKFFNITIPLLGRTFSFVLAMTLISHFQMFAQFQVLATKGGPNNSGTVLTYLIYKTAFMNKNMGYASAIAFALFVLIMVVTIIQQRFNKVDWGY